MFYLVMLCLLYFNSLNESFESTLTYKIKIYILFILDSIVSKKKRRFKNRIISCKLSFKKCKKSKKEIEIMANSRPNADRCIYRFYSCFTMSSSRIHYKNNDNFYTISIV